MKRSAKTRRLVEACWLDAATGNEWISGTEAEAFTPVACKTAGYLIARTKTHVTIASTVGAEEGDSECNAITTIPKAWLTKPLRFLD
jgi:hypothetical protein